MPVLPLIDLLILLAWTFLIWAFVQKGLWLAFASTFTVLGLTPYDFVLRLGLVPAVRAGPRGAGLGEGARAEADPHAASGGARRAGDGDAPGLPGSPAAGAAAGVGALAASGPSPASGSPREWLSSPAMSDAHSPGPGSPASPRRQIWLDGRLVPWSEVTVHVLSHSMARGSLVFDYMSVHETPRGAGHLPARRPRRALPEVGGAGGPPARRRATPSCAARASRRCARTRARRW